MTQGISLYAVDDDPMVLTVVRGIAEPIACVECFDSAEACQERLAAAPPDLLLLDISLPGMDGYSYCRQLKNDSVTMGIPVIFVSANDGIDDRLAGYDAGAEDFIVKPFNPHELLRKIRVAGRIRADKHKLIEQMAAAEQLTSLVLASMDESSIVLQFMSKLIGWETEAEIAAGLLELMQRYRLTGAVQTRVGPRAYTLSPEGANLPLEVSILNHVRTMERIFEFRNRAVYNFERVTVMVANMPLADGDQCGRIRDNLAIAAQGAEARLAALETAEARVRSQGSLMTALKSLQGTLVAFKDAQTANRRRGSALAFDIEQDLARSFVHLGMTTGQERFLEDMLRNRIAELMEIVDQGDELEGILSRLLEELAAVGNS
jgi:DNA-binding response OmpR family regulator